MKNNNFELKGCSCEGKMDNDRKVNKPIYIIPSASQFDLSSINEVFLKNMNEKIVKLHNEECSSCDGEKFVPEGCKDCPYRFGAIDNDILYDFFGKVIYDEEGENHIEICGKFKKIK